MTGSHEQLDELERAGKMVPAFRLAEQLASQGDPTALQTVEFAVRASELALSTLGVERGAEFAERARDLSKQCVNPSAAALAAIAVARVQLRQHTDSSVHDARAALDSIADDGLSAAMAATREKLYGLIAARTGRPRDALGHFATAYDRAEGRPALRARILLTWAVQLRNWGLFDDAQRRAERSLELRLSLADHYGAAMCYGTLAFVYQRQGMWQEERDALAADLRICERIGSTADLPALHGRLAGALVGLGKYAAAWAQAQRSLELEDARLGGGVDDDRATRTHGYALREQARVCLAQHRLEQGAELAHRSSAIFSRLGDRYGAALAQLTRAEVALVQSQRGHAQASSVVQTAVAACQPVFVALGAVPEAVNSILIEVELGAAQGQAEQQTRRIVQQVLPMLQQAGLGASALFRRACELAYRLSPVLARDRAVTQASMLRSVAAIAVETGAQPASVVAVRAGAVESARAFGRAAVNQGAVVSWPDSELAVAAIIGDEHDRRAQRLLTAIGDVEYGMASGDVDLEHMWPAGVRARGQPIEAAIDALRKAETGDP